MTRKGALATQDPEKIGSFKGEKPRGGGERDYRRSLRKETIHRLSQGDKQNPAEVGKWKKNK